MLQRFVKRLTSFMLVIMMVLGTFFMSPMHVEAKSEFTVSSEGLCILKQFEGFAKYPYYDYSQYTVGYGTYCPKNDLERYQRDGITEQEAEALLKNYLVNMEKGLNTFIDKYGLTLTQSQFDSLALFTYNCGASWMYNNTGIRNAVVNGYTGNDFIYEMSRWCSAGGSVLSGLIRRRLAEADMYLNGTYSSSWPNNYSYVRFNGNGGTIGAKVQGFSTGEVAVKGTATRTGYTFLGWYTETSGGTKVSTLTNSLAKGTILYAQWKDNSIVETPTVPEEKPIETPVQPEQTPETPKEDTSTTVSKGTVYNCYSLRVRAGAGKDTKTVAYLKVGDPVEILEQKTVDDTTWGRISKGWVSMRCIKLEEVATPPVEEKPVETPVQQETPKEETSQTVQKTQTGTIVNCTFLTVRRDAGKKNAATGWYKVGTTVNIYETKTADGKTWGKTDKGWISLAYVSLGEFKSFEGTVTANGLRIRQNASLAAKILGSVNKGYKVTITEIKSADGMQWGKTSKGWISLNYVKS